MKKIIYRSIISLILIIFASIIYLSTIGINTKKFNNLIVSKVRGVDSNFDLEINKISLKLIPFSYAISLKTLGTNLIYKDEAIKLESIKSQISIKSLIDNQFALTEFGAANQMSQFNVGNQFNLAAQNMGAQNQFALANMSAQNQALATNAGTANMQADRAFEVDKMNRDFQLQQQNFHTLSNSDLM